MRSADHARVCLRALLVVGATLTLAACGGGSTTETTIIGGGVGGTTAQMVVQNTPTGPNTTEIVVDSGPPDAFALGVVNIPYVSVKVCSPGSSSQCVVIDHVLLDTGSIGLRVLKSKVASLGLPEVAMLDINGNPASAAECYPFVLGAIWGPVVTADLQIEGESASALVMQLIDDDSASSHPAPAECVAASNGGLLNSVSALGANGVLGIGMIDIDCGLSCLTDTHVGTYALYYSCSSGSTTCTPAAMPAISQVQNPVARFAVNKNGAMIVMPAVPEAGASIAKGRLVFGIGTQTNNQLPPAVTMYLVNADPSSPDYLYISTKVGSRSYTNSYIDTGSNAMFFDEATLLQKCQVSAGSTAGWYCPPTPWRQTATVTDTTGTPGSIDFSIASADALFSTVGTAFDNLGGSAGQAADTFVWGMPFFYGRTVFVSIWGQPLSPNGPWYAF